MKSIKKHIYTILFAAAGIYFVFMIGSLLYAYGLNMQYRKFYSAFSNSYYSCNKEDVKAVYNGEELTLKPDISYRFYVYISAAGLSSPAHKEKNVTDGPLTIYFKDKGYLEIYAEKLTWSDRIRDTGTYVVYHYPDGKIYHFLTDKMSLEWMLLEIENQKYAESGKEG